MARRGSERANAIPLPLIVPRFFDDAVRGGIISETLSFYSAFKFSVATALAFVIIVTIAEHAHNEKQSNP